MKKPNLFRIATKELSQDGFFTWFIQWAHDNCSTVDKELNASAKDFVRLLLGEKFTDDQIRTVNARRQWNDIDILVEVNDKYIIVIEDKTNTKEHSKQLERYKEIVTNHYKNKKLTLAFVYLKTGNESTSTLAQVKEKGYSVIDREAILRNLNARSINNDIFNDFKDYLTEIENETNRFSTLDNLKTWRAGEGFYSELQKRKSGVWTDWRYVANPKGGFLGFWYHWRRAAGIGDIYIQIENAFELGLKLVIRIGSWNQNTNTLYSTLNGIKPFAEKNDLIITKPAKYKAGTTSTLAVVQNAFDSTENGLFDFDNFLSVLARLEKTINSYCERRKQLSEQ